MITWRLREETQVGNQVLSIRTIEAAKPCAGRDVYTWDNGLRGFGLRVTPRGVKSYVLQYRVNGGPARRTTIGIHGSPWTTQTARREAERLLMLVRQGVDPVEQAREAKRQSHVLNFAKYCDQFVELYLRPNWTDSWVEAMRVLETVAKPRWGKKPLAKISRNDVVRLMDEYAGRPGSRKMIHSVLRKLFNWAVDRQDIEVSPLTGMKAPKALASRRRVLGQEELVCLWQATEGFGWPWGPFVRMLVLTMQRRQEVAEMDWSEIDLDARLWTLPAERAKNDEAHLVPLSDMVMEEFRKLGPRQTGLVFSTTGITPVSGFSKAKRLLSEATIQIMRDRAAANGKDSAAVSIPEWRLHDLRRTGATNLQALGIPIEVTEAVLNHISGTRAGVAGIYNRYKYEPQKEAALQAWASRLTEMLAGPNEKLVSDGSCAGPSRENVL
jgi:integrase